MGIVNFAMAALFSVPLWAISRHFRARLAMRERVVMNWSFDGKPNSHASPRMALNLTPTLGTLTLFLVAGLVSFAVPPEEQIVALLMIPLTAFVFTGCHMGHLHFAARSSAG
jgi:hypothetical protein